MWDCEDGQRDAGYRTGWGGTDSHSNLHIPLPCVITRVSSHTRAHRLSANVDVLVENFRPGVMEGWGLGPAHLRPDLIYTRISGYGQVGGGGDAALWVRLCGGGRPCACVRERVGG